MYLLVIREYLFYVSNIYARSCVLWIAISSTNRDDSSKASERNFLSAKRKGRTSPPERFYRAKEIVPSPSIEKPGHLTRDVS